MNYEMDGGEEVMVKPSTDTSYEMNAGKIKLSSRRFMVLFVLSLALFANGEAWCTFGSVIEQSQSYFGVNSQSVEWFGNVFLLAYAVEAIPCTFIPQLIGLRLTLVVGCLLNLVGSFIRWISFVVVFKNIFHNFLMCIFGNMFFGFAQGFLLNIPSLVSTVWFGEHERSASTAIAYTCNTIGVGIGFLDVFLLMQNTNDKKHIYSTFYRLSLAQFVMNGFIMICACIFVHEQPKYAPSRSQMNKKVKVTNLNFIQSLKDMMTLMCQLLKRFQSLIALAIFSTNYGCYVAIYIFLSGIINDCMTDQQSLTGYIGAIGVICGGVLTVVVGVVMNKTHNRRNKLIGLLINLMCAFPLLILILLISIKRLNNEAAFILFVAYLMFCPVYIPVGTEILAEITYPIDANISSNEAFIMGNIIGVLLVYTIGIAPVPAKYFIILTIAIALYIINAFLLYRIKFERNRARVDAMTTTPLE